MSAVPRVSGDQYHVFALRGTETNVPRIHLIPARILKKFDFGAKFGKARNDVHRAVFAAAVDDDNLIVFDTGLLQQTGETLADRMLFVERRDDRGNFQATSSLYNPSKLRASLAHSYRP